MARERPWDRDDRDRDDDDRPRRRRDEDDDDDDRPRRRREEEDDYDDDRPRRRRRYEGDDDDDRPRRRPRDYDDRPQGATNGAATAALVLGLLAFCTGPLTGVPAVICALVAMGKPTGRGMAVAGLLLGVVGTVLVIVGGYFGFMRVRQSAARMRDANNMKQIGLAMHNQHDATGRMGAPYALDRGGQPNTGLSWRVGVLPYIEQDNLYRQFNMDEPWDGPRNKSLSNTAIRTYTTPFGGQEEASVYTPYRVFYGGGAMFNEDGRPVSLRGDIPDGNSNTIMVVHAADQVRWAEPMEFRYSPDGSLPKLGHPDAPGGFQVLFADGSVRFARDTISERQLRGLITRAGGEAVGGGDW